MVKEATIHFYCQFNESHFLKKGGGSMVQGQVFLKGVDDTFPISFFQGLSFLHLEITLPFAKLCYAFEKKKFFCHHNFMKKGHSKLIKIGKYPIN